MRAPLVSLLSVLLVMPTRGFFFGGGMQKTRMLCVNSLGNPTLVPPDPAGPQVICVRCNAQQFPQTATTCTGVAQVPATTTTSQALCLINNCIQQYPQKPLSIPGFGTTASGATPGSAGRKRRQIMDQNQLDDEAVFTSVG